MMRLIPPIAVPFGLGAVASSVLKGVERPTGTFASQLAARFGARKVALFGSGRAALAAALSASRRTTRDEVSVPAYTCWSVPAAVVRAGCRVRPYDVDPSTFLPATDSWQGAAERTAGVVVADLLSFLPGWDAVVSAIHRKLPEALLVEDRAQSWPARVSPEGVTLLSFGRGKPLPLGGGGALLASRWPLRVGEARLQPAGLRGAAVLMAMIVLGRPGIYRLPASIPALGVGRTVFDPEFDDTRSFLGWQDRLGVRLLTVMEDLSRARSRNAAHLADFVGSIPKWRVGPWSEGPLRLPVYAPSRSTRDRTIGLLRSRGVAAGALYPGTLMDIPALYPHLTGDQAEFLGAQEIADRLLTLPVYPTLRAADIHRIGRDFAVSAKEAES